MNKNISALTLALLVAAPAYADWRPWTWNCGLSSYNPYSRKDVETTGKVLSLTALAAGTAYGTYKLARVVALKTGYGARYFNTKNGALGVLNNEWTASAETKSDHTQKSEDSSVKDFTAILNQLTELRVKGETNQRLNNERNEGIRRDISALDSRLSAQNSKLDQFLSIYGTGSKRKDGTPSPNSSSSSSSSSDVSIFTSEGSQ